MISLVRRINPLGNVIMLKPKRLTVKLRTTTTFVMKRNKKSYSRKAVGPSPAWMSQNLLIWRKLERRDGSILTVAIISQRCTATLQFVTLNMNFQKRSTSIRSILKHNELSSTLFKT